MGFAPSLAFAAGEGPLRLASCRHHIRLGHETQLLWIRAGRQLQTIVRQQTMQKQMQLGSKRAAHTPICAQITQHITLHQILRRVCQTRAELLCGQRQPFPLEMAQPARPHPRCVRHLHAHAPPQIDRLAIRSGKMRKPERQPMGIDTILVKLWH